jgi:hypothetical protein
MPARARIAPPDTRVFMMEVMRSEARSITFARETEEGLMRWTIIVTDTFLRFRLAAIPDESPQP